MGRMVDGGDGAEDVGGEGEVAGEEVEGGDEGLGLLDVGVRGGGRVLYRRRHVGGGSSGRSFDESLSNSPTNSKNRNGRFTPRSPPPNLNILYT